MPNSSEKDKPAFFWHYYLEFGTKIEGREALQNNMSENKIKHLEFTQSVINRLARNSFMIKGWSVTLVAALLTVGSIQPNSKVVLLAYIPVVIFWGLDAYFLWQERIFRKLYDSICEKNENQIDFSLNPKPFSAQVGLTGTAFSITLVPFYGVLIGAIVAVICLGE